MSRGPWTAATRARREAYKNVGSKPSDDPKPWSPTPRTDTLITSRSGWLRKGAVSDDPSVARSYNPKVAQAELEAATDERFAEAGWVLGKLQGTRADNPERFERAQREYADARAAYKAARIFGPGVGL